MLLLSFNPIMLWVAVILISVLLEAVTLSLSAIWSEGLQRLSQQVSVLALALN